MLKLLDYESPHSLHSSPKTGCPVSAIADGIASKTEIAAEIAAGIASTEIAAGIEIAAWIASTSEIAAWIAISTSPISLAMSLAMAIAISPSPSA